MNEILIAAIAAGGGAAVGGIFQLIMWLVNRKAEEHDKRGEVADGVMLLLQDRLKFLAKHYISDGQVSAEDLEDLMRMHETYHKLGGNGYLDALLAAVKNLKLIK